MTYTYCCVYSARLLMMDGFSVHHQEAWSGAASSTLCGATYISVAIPSALEQSVYIPLNINICNMLSFR